MKFEIPDNQWRYFRHWLIVVIIAEVFMLVFNLLLVKIYLSFAILFLASFLLRVLKLYPGEDEPLILDFSAVVLSLCFAFTARWLDSSNWRFLLILCSSFILLAHFLYIASIPLRDKRF